MFASAEDGLLRAYGIGDVAQAYTPSPDAPDGRMLDLICGGAAALEAASSEFTAEMRGRAEIGALLASARKCRSLTQPALSELTGIQQAEISRIERGVGNPTAATLLRLADALGQKLTLVPTVR